MCMLVLLQVWLASYILLNFLPFFNIGSLYICWHHERIRDKLPRKEEEQQQWKELLIDFQKRKG